MERSSSSSSVVEVTPSKDDIVSDDALSSKTDSKCDPGTNSCIVE